jgi:DNA-binding MarR family transcriptional regulator
MRMLYGKEPMLPSRLAAQLGLTRGAVTKLADRLIAKNLTVREANPDDGRAQTLGLTAQGSAFVPELAALADQNDAECFGHLSDGERRALERILKETVTRFGLTSIPVE